MDSIERARDSAHPYPGELSFLRGIADFNADGKLDLVTGKCVGRRNGVVLPVLARASLIDAGSLRY
jgi:hypothetical protein